LSHSNSIVIKRPIYKDPLIILLSQAGAILVLLTLLFAESYLRAVLITGAVIYLGFVIPLWVGRRARLQRAIDAKQRELARWGFHSRDQEGPWINHIDGPVMMEVEFTRGKHFCSEWLVIDDGRIIVNPGQCEIEHELGRVTYFPRRTRTYAWDGCTPKRYFFWILLFGAPDWWEKTFILNRPNQKGVFEAQPVLWPMAHYASLVHDAFYQYLHVVPVSKDEVDKLFYDMLVQAGMWPPLAWLYHRAVRSNDEAAASVDGNSAAEFGFFGY
jgi:hypothetical protein